MLNKVIKVAFAASLLFAISSPASAASYRYWGFFNGENGAWSMSMIGAAENIPEDGSVDGWRFGIGTDTETPEPRTAPNFEELCPDTQAAEGITRVAVVIDFGDADQAPDGEVPPTSRVECVSMPTGGSSADALAMAADVRGDGGFVCGLDGFPAAECGAEVAEPVSTPVEEAVAAETEEDAVDEGGNLLVYAALVLAVVLGVVFVVSKSKK